MTTEAKEAPMAGRSPVKVVHVVVAGQIGGAERFLVNLASRPGADHCIALMTPNPDLRAFFVNAGVKVRDRGPVQENPLAYLWRSYGPSDIAWLCEVAQQERADILHAHTYGSHVLAARAGQRLGIPVVRTEHGVRHYRDPSCALNRLWALKHTDRIVAVSDFVGRTVAAIAPHAADKITVVPNGIDMDWYRPSGATIVGPVRFAVIGRLEPVKRVHLAIEALTQLAGVHLTIAGDGRERARLERLTQKLGLQDRVRFLGHVSDTRTVLAACDAVINTTRDEGLGLAVIEAAAMGKPAVAFASGGIPEIVQDRQTGWLTHTETAAGLAALLAEAAADRARLVQMGVAARRWVEARFGLDAMCAGYANVYGELRPTAGQQV